ncbi:MAG TPA: response regulator [bacterium]|nr:response regulator [bacterium]
MAKVLIVDDEVNIREAFREFLEADEHKVVLAGDANAAIQLLNENHFDVVITDIIMPRKSGVELLKEIKELSPHTQVIMITGEPTVETASQAVRAGAFDYMSKPLEGKKIRELVIKASRAKELLDEKKRVEEENEYYRQHLERLVQERTAELDATNEKLHKALTGIIQAMTLTIEKRDPYTAGHQMRVGQLAKKLAEEMELSAKLIEGTFMAGVVHDIGKIAVPAEILTKPGKLTEEEMALIKKHTKVGYDILNSIDFPWPIAETILQHHERMDGSGYPQGLVGEEICLEARILAVADVVEAMAHHRPYRPALGIGRALDEIAKNKDRFYDPNVAESCHRLFYNKGFTF